MKVGKTAAASPRLAIAKIIAAWISAGRFPDREIGGITAGRAFVTEVVFGVVRNYSALRFFRERLAARRPAAPIEAVILAALYELFYLDDAQPYATVHQAVEVARELAGRRSAAFVNAVLRQAQREEKKLRAALENAPPATRLSHPPALMDRWTRHFGVDDTVALCAWNNSRPETVLNVLQSRASVDALVARARAENIELAPHQSRPETCVILPRGIAVEDVPGYADGWFVVQDPSTLGAVDLLAPLAGELIVDSCASPGGKAAAIWDRMKMQGTLIACDIHDDRVRLLRENFDRLKMPEIHVAITDSADRSHVEAAMKSAKISSPDAILLDVPCSNTGVLRRRADARWRFNEVRLAQLTELQARILGTAAAILRPGGRIVYSTCSLEAEENERQVQRFLAGNPAFKLDAEIKSFPPASGMDGSFAARLVHCQ